MPVLVDFVAYEPRNSGIFSAGIAPGSALDIMNHCSFILHKPNGVISSRVDSAPSKTHGARLTLVDACRNAGIIWDWHIFSE